METINKEGRRSMIISEIKCMCTNVRSIMNKGKREELQNLLFEKGIAILGVTESWAHEDKRCRIEYDRI